MIQIDTKDLNALLQIANTDDSLWYTNGVYFTNSVAIACDAVLLVKTGCFTEENADSVFIKTAYLKQQLTIAKALKAATVSLTPDESNTMPGKYPPYILAFPINPVTFAQYNLNQLITVLTALKATSTKNAHVVLASDSGNFNRPLHLSLDQFTTPQALIVPVRS